MGGRSRGQFVLQYVEGSRSLAEVEDSWKYGDRDSRGRQRERMDLGGVSSPSFLE